MVVSKKKSTRKKKRGPVRKKIPSRPRPSAKSLANLTPFKKGEVGNPKGNNQYTGLRAIREKALKVIDKNFDELSERAVQLAKAGDAQLLKFLLQAGYEVRALQVLDDDGKALDFAELAKRARDNK